MIINLSSFFKSGELTYSIEKMLTITDLEFLKKNKIEKDIMFKGDFFKVDDSIELNATIRYTYKEVCARCLKEFMNTIETQFTACITDNEVEDSEEINIILHDNSIDIDKAIKQVIYLSIPMKSLCSEDCKGICPKCGANLNIEECDCENNSIDPRLEELKKLLKD